MKIAILCVLQCLFFISLSAQSTTKKPTRKDLENRRKHIQQEIEYTATELQLRKNEKDVTINLVKQLSAQIENRSLLVKNMGNEINSINIDITANKKNIDELELERQALRQEYATMVRQAAKNRMNYTQLVFVFAAADFKQAYKRLSYLKKHTQVREQKFIEIQNMNTQIGGQITSMNTNVTSKQSLTQEEQKQEEELKREKQKQEQWIKLLQGKEKELGASLEKKKEDAQQLGNEMDKILTNNIQTEQEQQNSIGQAVQKVTTSTTSLEKTHSTVLESKQGKLPFPVSKGYISENFGTYKHSILKNTTITNNGIDIATTINTPVYAISEGVVASILTLPRGNKAIILKHGTYLSIYSNLAKVQVQTGQKIIAKQIIGTVGIDTEDDKGELHFELWKSKVKQNPLLWIKK